MKSGVWGERFHETSINDSDAPVEAVVGESAVPKPHAGVAIEIRDLTVRAGGHAILQGIDLTIEPGEHVAVVGQSGAGKSSLVGILLGWHRPAGGDVLVDGAPLDGQRLSVLRSETAWVDPAVQIWNRSLLDNLHYGVRGASSKPLSPAIRRANLFDVLKRLPDGLQTVLGEGGGLVSGGEGQRVRLGRSILRPDSRLVVLDEAFRGLDREQRQALLLQAREHWAQATLIFISHDVAETQAFDRVLVIEQGRIVEDASGPATGASLPLSRPIGGGENSQGGFVGRRRMAAPVAGRRRVGGAFPHREQFRALDGC